MNLEQVNKAISELDNNSLVSDGYHTFEELYEHRCLLYLNLCLKYKDYCYWTYTNSDGSIWEGWLLLILNHPIAGQISYHLPNTLLVYFKDVIKYKDKCNDYDGHSSNNVVRRLQKLAVLALK